MRFALLLVLLMPFTASADLYSDLSTNAYNNQRQTAKATDKKRVDALNIKMLQFMYAVQSANGGRNDSAHCIGGLSQASLAYFPENWSAGGYSATIYWDRSSEVEGLRDSEINHCNFQTNTGYGCQLSFYLTSQLNPMPDIICYSPEAKKYSALKSGRLTPYVAQTLKSRHGNQGGYSDNPCLDYTTAYLRCQQITDSNERDICIANLGPSPCR